MIMKKSTQRSKKRTNSSKSKGLGNPALIATVLASPVTGQILKGVAIVGVGFVVYKLATGGLDKIQENRASKEYGNNTKTGLAAQYAAEFKSTGVGSYLSDTNEQALYVLADKMYRNGVGMDLVNTQYQRLYNLNLVTEISGDLNATELDRFNNILRGSGLNGLRGINAIKLL